MSDSVRPHRRQPTRLPCPWDSRQEQWSGLPFPSPMHESENEVAQSCLTLSDPMDCSLPGSSIQGFSRQEYWSGVPLLSPSYVIKKLQIKTAMRCHYTSIRTTTVQNTDNIKCCGGCGETGTLIHYWWECNIDTTTLQQSLAVSYKAKHRFTIHQLYSEVLKQMSWNCMPP